LSNRVAFISDPANVRLTLEILGNHAIQPIILQYDRLLA